MDLTTAINVAASYDHSLVEWLLESFDGYPQETFLHPNTDSDWTNLR